MTVSGAETAPALPRRVLVVVAAMTAIAPISIDLNLAAFPSIANDLGTGAAQVQLTLTAVLVGSAVGGLLFGPASDRWGRLRPLILGAVLTVAASILVASAPTIEILVVARFLQGAAGSAGMVIGRALIADRVTGVEAARAFNLLMSIVLIAPIVAPVAGSLLLPLLGWRGLLWLIVGYAVVVLVIVLAMGRSLVAGSTPHVVAASSQRPGVRSLPRTFWANVAVGSVGFAGLMTYVSTSPFVYQEVLGFSAQVYGLLFGLNSVALVAASLTSARLVRRYSVGAVLRAGVAGAVMATLLGLVVAAIPAVRVWLPAPIMLATFSLGLVLGNASSLALSAARGATGLGSALLGAVQPTLAALVAPLATLGGGASPVSLMTVMTVCALVTSGAYLVSGDRNAEVTGHPLEDAPGVLPLEDYEGSPTRLDR